MESLKENIAPAPLVKTFGETLEGKDVTTFFNSYHDVMTCLCRDKYCPKMGPDKRILDFELEILKDAEDFIILQHQEQGFMLTTFK